MNIKPIETVYNGYRFRSRLEARWAVFFDAAGIKYQYELEGFELEDGTRYLPDFYLPELDTHCEVKANIVSAMGDVKRCFSMVKWGGPIKRIVFLSDIPGESKDGGMWHFPVICWDNDEAVTKWFFFFEDYNYGIHERCTGHVSKHSFYQPAFGIDRDGELFFNPEYGLGAVSDEILRRRPAYGYIQRPDTEYETNNKKELIALRLSDNKLVFDSFRKARQARFEHGETPNTTDDRYVSVRNPKAKKEFDEIFGKEIALRDLKEKIRKSLQDIK